MIEVQRYLQGQVVDRRFPLLEYLGGTEHSSVFLTEYEYAEGKSRKAAIKLVEALPGHAEEQLIRWRLAAKFSHPNLLRLFEMDRCKVDGASMLYVVMEYAEEDLADTLLERPLTAAEVRDLLDAMVDVLGYIHSKGFVHGHVQPSNIMAIGDRVKISSDGICRIDESTERRNGQSRYSAPECATGAPTPASDIWSLSAMIVECLAGPLEKLQGASNEGISLPADLPAPFLEIARHSLIQDPKRRWDVTEIKARLQRKVTAEPPPPPLAPVPVQSKQVRAVPKRKYVLPFTLAGIASVAVLFGIALFHHGPNGSGTSVAEAETSADQPRSSSTPVPRAPASQPARSGLPVAAKEKSREPAPAKPEALRPVVAAQLVQGEVTHRVMPNVPRDASDTIWGTVRVRVRVSVDPSGNVAGAQFDNAGPSKYFARLSMAAAREWKFRPPRVNGSSVPSAWVIHFGYTKTGNKATPVELHP